MDEVSGEIVYQSYTAAQLTAQMAVHATVENLGDYMAESAALATAARDQVAGQFGIAYGADDVQKLDIYAHDNAAKAPVLIDIHGGGWTQGTKQTRALPAPAITRRSGSGQPPKRRLVIWAQ